MNNYTQESVSERVFRLTLVTLAIASCFVAVIHNIQTYRYVLGERQTAYKILATRLRVQGYSPHDLSENQRLRRDFYSLLEGIGVDGSIDRKHTAIYIDDDDFYRGRYIDKPQDTILEPCAIQPFSVPAVAGLALLSGLNARSNGCKYTAYGYQYLPQASGGKYEVSQPCDVADRAGLRFVIVIERKDDDLQEARLDCAKR
ncbi:hypothetical protein M3I53_24065 [Paraburkholderia sp. CNPSo 3272]|uniref:hypothetical protein n=1 Tax=Paraburkholderia sp. CNPSo 3272 TaxID=2940931 RepID=UPI0020B6680D|nr:hypothetical protein [Paraburkholderia sp. CNPSo 3272]MCP3726167.1 hypothetical protein [Paraburkholderia sp. CNPSo 3272]